MPVLPLGKERFDPDLSFAHRLQMGLGQVVATRFVELGLVEGATTGIRLNTLRVICLPSR